MNDFGLSSDVILMLQRYFAGVADVERVVIYGSRAKGTQRPASDIDFAVWCDDPHTIGRLITELEELPLVYHCDVTDYRLLSSVPLREHIDRFGQIFYSRSATQ